MLLIGMVCLGAVWGWLAARWVYRARWTLVLFALIGGASQLAWLQVSYGQESLLAYALSALLSCAVGLGWLRSLARRRA